MVYQLKFIDRLDRVVLALDIEATDDEAAVELGCAHCVGADMDADIYDGERLIIRVTPMTARLYLTDNRARQYQPSSVQSVATGLALRLASFPKVSVRAGATNFIL